MKYRTQTKIDDHVLEKNHCYDKDALDEDKKDTLKKAAPECTTRIEGAAYAAYSRRHFLNAACWRTLLVADYKTDEFKNGIRDYYHQYASQGSLSSCDVPAPARCQFAWCSAFLTRGISIRPLADLGVAVPLWHPKFGFKAGESSSVQASAGLLARAFIYDGKIDVRAGFGFANAVGSDGSSNTTAFAWTFQVGFFEVFGLGLLFLTDPAEGTTGKAITLSIDLVGVRDVMGQIANSKK